MRQLLLDLRATDHARPITDSRPSREAAFTLIELVVVMAVIGVPVAIAIPSYIQIEGRARETAAQVHLRSAVPAIELYFSENHTYVGISHAVLTTNYGAGIAPVTFPTAAATTYCVESTIDTRTFSKNGPEAPIVAGNC